MKKLFNLSFVCASALLVVAGTGCLKDEYYEDGLAVPKISESPKVVEIMGAPEGTTSYQSSSGVFFDISPNDTTVNLVTVRLASDQPADRDIQVTLDTVGAFETIIQPYNDTNHTHFEPLPEGKFTLTPGNMVVTIPAGQREGSLQITAKPNDYLGGSYAIGFKIKSVSDPSYIISGNFNNSFVIVGTKNQYDGVYEITGTMVDIVNPALSGRYPSEIHLVTTGPNSNAMFFPFYADFYHPISNAGSLSVYGLYSPEFTFGPDGTVTEVVNYYGQPADNGRSAAIDPTGINKYDLATREMKVSYFLLQPGTSVRTSFNETFRYVGPR
jgi:hypothetical protein